MTNHYFIGIRIPDGPAAYLETARQQWNLRSYKVLVPQEDMHITLVYIGADPHGELPHVLTSLQAIEQEAFEVTLDRVGTFGNPEKPRVIYAAVEDNRSLHRLYQKTMQALEGFRLRPDAARPYTPHVTLAKKWKGGPPLREDLEIGTVSFKAAAFSLFQVNLDRKPRYEPIRTYRLKEGD